MQAVKARHPTKSNSTNLNPLDYRHLSKLTLGALGVVYGDIGTSPLYALREAMHGLPLTPANLLGILSLIFWALILTISTKYFFIILRADNQGEGGVFAVLTLLKDHQKKYIKTFLILAMVGAGLLFGDAMLTPAISVLSAIEGINYIAPFFDHLIVPITIAILVLLFWQQRYGTGIIGSYFGPIILIWFSTLGVLGLLAILKDPLVLQAINPLWAIYFIGSHIKLAFVTLGSIFLVVTGGEALYADIGHFGRLPIQIGWFACALPGLLLNYFGQAALLLQHPQAAENPFYALAPTWFLYPLLVLSTLATIIASQAVIAAIFSLTKQAVLLKLIPETRIIQTSAHQQGQIYCPSMNLILALGTLFLVVVFQHSSKLASIYGIGVNLEMVIVTLLVTLVTRYLWHWSLLRMTILLGSLTTIDLLFLTSNFFKIGHGGWLPLSVAGVGCLMMWTWHFGTQLLDEIFYKHRPALTEVLPYLMRSSNIHPIPTLTAIFITDLADISGGSLLHYLKLNHTLPERVIILSISIANVPYIKDNHRYELTSLTKGFYRLVLHYGFMQDVDVLEALMEINKRAQLPLTIDIHDTTFFTETKNITVTRRPQKHLIYWQKRLFAYLQHNALTPIEFYKLPMNRTISIGVYCEI